MMLELIIDMMMFYWNYVGRWISFVVNLMTDWELYSVIMSYSILINSHVKKLHQFSAYFRILAATKIFFFFHHRKQPLSRTVRDHPTMCVGGTDDDGNFR